MQNNNISTNNDYVNIEDKNNFNSIENKSFIWNLIYEQGGFNDIPDSRIDNIKLLLDNNVTSIINDSSNQNKSNIELNKILLKSLYEDLKIYKINENRTNNTRKEVNINEFNRKLENHRNDMNSMLQIKHPEPPNFQDDNFSNLKDISESYDNLLKLRTNEIELSNQNNVNISNKTNNSKTSFVDLTTELFKIDEDISTSPEESNNHINLSNIKKISPNKKIEFLQPNRRSSIDSSESSESVLSINLDSVDYIENNDNNTVIYINKNLDNIKRIEKITNDKKNIDNKSDNNFNIHNKLNIIINKIDDLSKKYELLEKKLESKN